MGFRSTCFRRFCVALAGVLCVTTLYSLSFAQTIQVGSPEEVKVQGILPPIDCVPGGWPDPPALQCGDAPYTLYRLIAVPAQNGGAECPEETKTILSPCDCIPDECPPAPSLACEQVVAIAQPGKRPASNGGKPCDGVCVYTGPACPVTPSPTPTPTRTPTPSSSSSSSSFSSSSSQPQCNAGAACTVCSPSSVPGGPSNCVNGVWALMQSGQCVCDTSGGGGGCSLQCPPGQQPNAACDACEPSCPSPKVSDGNGGCTCPTGPQGNCTNAGGSWDSSDCSCDCSGAQPKTNWTGYSCICPAGTTDDGNGYCCPPGEKMINGQCQDPPCQPACEECTETCNSDKECVPAGKIIGSDGSCCTPDPETGECGNSSEPSSNSSAESSSYSSSSLESSSESSSVSSEQSSEESSEQSSEASSDQSSEMSSEQTSDTSSEQTSTESN